MCIKKIKEYLCFVNKQVCLPGMVLFPVLFENLYPPDLRQQHKKDSIKAYSKNNDKMTVSLLVAHSNFENSEIVGAVVVVNTALRISISTVKSVKDAGYNMASKSE